MSSPELHHLGKALTFIRLRRIRCVGDVHLVHGAMIPQGIGTPSRQPAVRCRHNPSKGVRCCLQSDIDKASHHPEDADRRQSPKLRPVQHEGCFPTVGLNDPFRLFTDEASVDMLPFPGWRIGGAG
jgi:hypothetical protein